MSAVTPVASPSTYLGLYIGGREASGVVPPISRRLLRGLQIILTMTLSFVILPGLVGVGLSATTSAVGDYFRWIGLGVGILLVLAGGATLADLDSNPCEATWPGRQLLPSGFAWNEAPLVAGAVAGLREIDRADPDRGRGVLIV